MRHDGVYALADGKPRTKKVFDISKRPIPEDWIQRIRALEQDVADLTQIVIDQATAFVESGMIPNACPITVEETIETITSTRTRRRYVMDENYPLLEHLTTTEYKSIHEIARECGRTLPNVASKLQLLKRNNLVENKKRIGWRKLSPNP